jgi:phosphatidate cytidylyltransferase
VQSTTEQNSEPEASQKVSGPWYRSVGLRVVTSIIAIPIVLVFVWFGGWAAFAACLLVVALGTYELHTMVLHSGYHPLILVSLALSTLFLASAMLPSLRLLLLEVGFGGALLISFPWLFSRKKLDGALVDWALTLAFSIYLGWPMSFILLLRGAQVSWPLPHGAWWVLAALIGTWSFDTTAFFTGRFFGRHKLAPSISPGKTWEGVLGGLVFSITASLLVTAVPLGVPWYMAVLLGILIAVAAVLGDLAESLIKRQTHVKDSGQIMPGHGGILDRADSLLFVFIAIYLFVRLAGYSLV